MTNIVSVVSGKGGCGKSLLTAVLGQTLAKEGSRVLLIDLDIFVRGLTVLLHRFRRPSKKVLGEATTSEIFGIFEENSENRLPIESTFDQLRIQRFLECDVLPAVKDLGEPLDYDDKDLSNEEFGVERLKLLLDSVKSEYDFIFLDNRAGMDSLVGASCKVSDVVLSVAEDDEVGRLTNINLVNFLRFRKKTKSIHSIINKGRNVNSIEDIKEKFEQQQEFGVSGVIPFDIDIMENFGSDRFWYSVEETLYFRALIDAWNNLAQKEDLREITLKNYKFAPSIFMKKELGKYSLVDRMLRFYSVMFIFAGIFYWAYYYLRQLEFGYVSMHELLSIGLVGMGVLMLLVSTSNIRKKIIKFFLGSKW